MKIKKLEINGFKSFVEKTSIGFPQGISAIVGPNGCGKSNVVDALRWVMGEQSVKRLRGKSMEDVIFSGSNGRQPLNMAEVSLTLANDNGNAPKELNDFTEVMLTRRLYRSGESAYFINKQPCRLKDIHISLWEAIWEQNPTPWFSRGKSVQLLMPGRKKEEFSLRRLREL